MDISSIVRDITSGVKTARQYVDEALQKAEASKDYNAFVSLTAERAKARADEIDTKIAAGEAVGKLAGVPFVTKDNYMTFGAPSTASARMLETFDTPYQATIIEKLEAEGAICIGKANLDAFAHGGSTEHSYFGVTKNAIDTTRVAGGSSGGSAVVTALDIVPFALGSDTGGSIRQPAAFNGVYGMKPTYGAISRYGVVAMASSTDVLGFFSKFPRDIDLLMQITTGRDSKDMTTLPDFYQSEAEPRASKKKVGIIRETMTDDVQPEVRGAVTQYAEVLKTQGYEVEEVSLDIVKYTLAMYYIIVPAELSSNLARYDSIRYGHRAEGARSLGDVYGQSRDEGFMAENKRRIMIGGYVLSSGYFDAYYLKAQKARTLLMQAFDKLFAEYDFLLTPTTPTTAFGIGENLKNPVAMYMSDIMTVPASLAGLPAISVPHGKDGKGLPIGVQIVGPQKSDASILALADQTKEAAS